MSDTLFSNIPDDWKSATLGDVCCRSGGKIQTGPFGSQLHASDYVPVGVPSIMPVNIGENRINPSGISQIAPADAERLSRHIVRKGDIIYSRRGDVERRALIRDREDGWFCGTGCLRIRFGSGSIDPEFVSYYLAHPAVRGWIVRHAVGATMPNLNTSIMSAVPLLVPPHTEQLAIAEILASLDDKIELNRRMNRTLEQMAAAIFRAWFVDFEPVKAKADGAKSFPSMPQKVFDALPTEFTDSSLGPIPKGWNCSNIEDQCSLVMGQSPRSEHYNGDGDGLPFHQGVRGFGERFPNHDTHCTVQNRLAESGDVLFSVRAPVGRINVADRKLIVGRGLAAIRHSRDAQTYLLYALKHQFHEEDSI